MENLSDKFHERAHQEQQQQQDTSYHLNSTCVHDVREGVNYAKEGQLTASLDQVTKEVVSQMTHRARGHHRAALQHSAYGSYTEGRQPLSLNVEAEPLQAQKSK